MARIFYKGKLSPLLKVVMIINNILSWVIGNSRDKDAMKKRIHGGYEAQFSEDVARYDELTLTHYIDLAESLVDGIDCKDKTILDIGSGTGALTRVLLDKGTAKVVCVDSSRRMLDDCRKKFDNIESLQGRIEYELSDAEQLPYEDNSFDLVVSGMVLGMIIDQKRFISEMHRVVRPGGKILISTHGPEWYFEIIETLSRCMLRYYPVKNLGYSGGAEFWPFTEKIFQQLLKKEGISKIDIKSHKGQINFKNGCEAWEFFAACSSAWFLEQFKPEERKWVVLKIRNYFMKKNITDVSYEALMCSGLKEI